MKIDSRLFKRAGLYLIISSGLHFVGADISNPKAPDTKAQSASQGESAPSGSADNFLFTGSFLYNVPIEVPPGIAGIQPVLSLQYNSSQSNSWVGLGWDLSLGSIQRSTKNGPPKYDGTFGTPSTDIFTVTLKGMTQELTYVGMEGQTFIYRAKIDDALMKFILSKDQAHWTVVDKSGTQYFFTNSWIAGQGIFLWALDKVTDRYGNYMTISYSNDQNELYPDTILYTSNDSASPKLSAPCKVTFTLQNRPDSIPTYRAAIQQVIGKRLSQINTYTYDKQSNTWVNVKTYDLHYSTPSLRIKSELTFIQVTGKDSSQNTLTLPIATYTYLTAGSGWSAKSFPAMPWQSIYLNNSQSMDYGVRFADLNGDGRADMLVGLATTDTAPGGNNRPPTLKAYLYTPTGWQPNATYTPPIPFSVIHFGNTEPDNSADANGVQVVDVNGDGRADIIYAKYSSPQRSVWLNTDHGWDATLGAPWILPPQVLLSAGQGIEFADLNGDGLVDILRSDSGMNAAWLNTGSGWVEDDTWASPVRFMDSNGKWTGVRIVDVNGDGLPDIVSSIDDRSSGTSHITNQIYLNAAHALINGNYTSWVLSNSSAPAMLAVKGPSATYDRNVQFVDVNGDGLLDWVESTFGEPFPGGVPGTENIQNHTWLNTGTGWISGGSQYTFPITFMSMCGDYRACSQGALFLDLDGDGQPDLIQSKIFNNVISSGTWVSNAKPELVQSVQNAMGGTTVLSYDSIFHQSTNNKIPFPVSVLSQMQSQDGRGGGVGTTYSYNQGLYDVGQKEFLGFGQVTTTDADGNYSVTYYHQDKDSAGNPAPASCFKGRVYKLENHAVGGKLMSSQDTLWNQTQPFSGYAAYFVRPTSSKSTLYDGSSGFITEQDFYYDETVGSPTYGNILRTVSQPGAANERDDYVEYAVNSSLNLLNFPSRKDTKTAGGALVSDSIFLYDNYTTAGSIDKGNVTAVEKSIDLSNSNWATTKSEYKDPVFFSYVTAVVDANGNRTQTSYDANGFPITVTNALSQTLSSTYDTRNGNVKTETNVNGQITQYTYDPMGRLLKEIGPLDTDALPSVEYNYHGELLGNPSQQYTEKNVRVQNKQAAVLTSKTYFDGLGRTYKTETPANAGQTVISETTYNGRGLADNVSVPRFSSDTGTVLQTHTSYDALGRVIEIDRPDQHSLVTNYQATSQSRITSVTDANGNVQTSEADAYGHIIYRHEPLPIQHQTAYSYDILGNLLQLTDSRSQISQFSYDPLGRKISMSDPNTGLWHYGYDNVGNLTSQTDARGIQITMQYDALNRLTIKKTPTETITYVYDEPDHANAKGRLTTIADSSGNTQFFYDSLGRVTKQVKIVGASVCNAGSSNCFNVLSSYDALNRITQIIYPGGETVNYAYNSGGQLSRITNVDGTTVYAAYSGYDALGHTGELDQANSNTRTAFTYDSKTQVLASIKTDSYASGSAQRLRDLSYQFDPMGNVHEIDDNQTGQKQIFQYDPLDRLTQAQGQGAYGTENYTYDDVGNFQTKEGVTYTYGNPSHPYAVTATNTQGNLAQDSSTILAWNLDPSEQIYSIKGRVVDSSGVGAPNVPVVLSGPFSQSVKTNNSPDPTLRGQFEFDGVAGGTGGQFNVFVASVGYTTSPLGATFTPLTQNQIGLQFQLALDTNPLTMSLLRIPRSTIGSGIPSPSMLGGGFTAGVMIGFYGNSISTGSNYSNQSGYSPLSDSTDSIHQVTNPYVAPPIALSSISMGPTFVDGINQKALSFSGKQDIFVIPYKNLSINPSAMTAMIWAKPGAYPTSGCATLLSNCTSYAAGSLHGGFRLMLSSGGYVKAELGTPSGSSINLTSTHMLTLNAWAFLCVTYDGAKVHLYINGQEETSLAYTNQLLPNGNVLTLGASLDGNFMPASNTFFTGVLDEPRIHNRAWSAGEISQIYFSARAVGQYDYDADGNMISKVTPLASWSYQYDAQGRLTQIQKGPTLQSLTSFSQFVYDGDGGRVQKTTPDGTTVYIGKLYETRPDGSAVHHIFAGGQVVADLVKKSGVSQFNYYHTDHLGSVSLVTDQNGNQLQSISYKPFGETFQTTGSSSAHYKYTGQEEDAESGLYFYNARYYDPLLGRFISPDSAVPNAMDPQSLNRYSYVRNNPLILTDPDGHFAFLIPIIVGAIIGAYESDKHGGNLFQGAVMGALAGAFGEVIGASFSGAIGGGALGTIIGQTAGGAVAGGVSALMAGGNSSEGFKMGALGGFVSGATNVGIGVPMVSQIIGGGLASKATGGKFWAGARMAAYASALMAIGNSMSNDRPEFNKDDAKQLPDGTAVYLKSREAYIKLLFWSIGDDMSHVIFKSNGQWFDTHWGSSAGPLSDNEMQDLFGRGYISVSANFDTNSIQRYAGIEYMHDGFQVCTVYASRASDGTLWGLSPGQQAYNTIGYRPGAELSYQH